MNRSSEPVSGAGLDGEGAEDGAGDGDKVLGYLDDFVPIDFHFTQNKFKRNTLLIKGHTDCTDYTDFILLNTNRTNRTNNKTLKDSKGMKLILKDDSLFYKTALFFE